MNVGVVSKYVFLRVPDGPKRTETHPRIRQPTPTVVSGEVWLYSDV